MLLDVRMPRLNGLEAFRRIRRLVPSLPVIFLTRHASDEEQQEIARMGANGWLPKPIDVFRLDAELRRVLAAS